MISSVSWLLLWLFCDKLKCAHITLDTLGTGDHKSLDALAIGHI